MAGEDAQTGRRPAPDPAQEPVWRSDMVDVNGLSLAELVELTAAENTPLAGTLRRLAADLADPGEPVAGFNSAL